MDQQIEKRFENVSKSKTFKNIVKVFDLDKKSVLDIGCSYGEFLAHFGDGSMGITINPDEVDRAALKGLKVELGNVESEELILKDKFDVIFANNIFEHLYSPHAFLIKIKQYIKDGGYLILGVPCIPKIVSLLHLNKFKGSLSTSHINFFTKSTLVKTVERAGYEVKAARGFRLNNKVLDHILDFIYPHFYIVAFPQENFAYDTKRMKELVGYKMNL